MPQASVIVVGNEKGGAGKSTIAIHTATALLHGEARVVVLDLDVRQQSTAHFFAHRAAWLDANGVTAPMPMPSTLSADIARMSEDDAMARFQDAFARAKEDADFVLIDISEPGTFVSALNVVVAEGDWCWGLALTNCAAGEQCLIRLQPFQVQYVAP